MSEARQVVMLERNRVVRHYGFESGWGALAITYSQNIDRASMNLGEWNQVMEDTALRPAWIPDTMAKYTPPPLVPAPVRNSPSTPQVPSWKRPGPI